jgi:lipopolysaccharide/colanic/teichoic acid biosynthesis glycosyltransferase
MSDTINRTFKRLFDLAMSLVWLVMTAPVMGFIAALLWLGSFGNVIFSQRRIGKDGDIFFMYKFRKFPPHWKEEGPGVTLPGDARMTWFGTILERTKLDELPQIWNVLKGEMSFVGPRPESTRYAELYTGDYATLHNFLPGIFGPSQIAFRNEVELYPADEDPEEYYRRVLFPKKAAIDLAYYRDANVLKDFVWVIKGVFISITGLFQVRRFMNLHSKIIIADIILIWCAWFLANLTRFAGLPPVRADFYGFLSGFVILPLTVIPVMIVGGGYRHPVRYFSFYDGIRLGFIVPPAWLTGFVMLLGFTYRNLSFYLIPVGCLFLIPLLTFPRIWNRMRWINKQTVDPDVHHRVLIYGAGSGGAALASWMKEAAKGMNLLGFLDDDSDLRGKQVCGFKVLGRESDIPTIHEVHRIKEIWVTFQLTGIKRKRLHAMCENLSIRLVVFPDLEPFSRFMPSNGSSGLTKAN